MPDDRKILREFVQNSYSLGGEKVNIDDAIDEMMETDSAFGKRLDDLSHDSYMGRANDEKFGMSETELEEARKAGKTNTVDMNERYQRGRRALKDKQAKYAEEISEAVSEVIRKSPSYKSKDLSIKNKIELRKAVGEALGDFPVNGELLRSGKASRKVLGDVFKKLLKTVPLIGGIYTAGEIATGGAHASEMLPEAIIPTSANMGGKDEHLRRAVERGESLEDRRASIEDPQSFEDLRAIRDRLLKGR